MATDLATIRAQVQGDLDDAGAATWTAGEIDRAIRRALREYSVHCPYRTDGTITVATAGREQSLSTLTGLCDVERVWFPYYSAEPDLLPAWVNFEMRLGASLFLLSRDSPAVGEKMRVYYWKMQTIKDLDSAAATTLPVVDEDLIALGAAGYAALEMSRSAVGVVNVSGYTPLHWRDWAECRLRDFEAGVYAAMGRLALAASGAESME